MLSNKFLRGFNSIFISVNQFFFVLDHFCAAEKICCLNQTNIFFENIFSEKSEKISDKFRKEISGHFIFYRNLTLEENLKNTKSILLYGNLIIVL